MTTEQAEAFAQLRTLAAASRLRVRPDAEGWPVIPGRLGQIEWYCNGQDCHGCPLPGEPALAVSTDRPRLFPKLWAIPGVRRWQTGDREMRAVFPPEALEQVAGLIRARRRRIQSPAQTQNLAKGPRSAVSRPQDRADAGAPALDTSAGPEASAIPKITPISGVKQKEPLMLLERTMVEPGDDVSPDAREDPPLFGGAVRCGSPAGRRRAVRHGRPLIG